MAAQRQRQWKAARCHRRPLVDGGRNYFFFSSLLFSSFLPRSGSFSFVDPVAIFVDLVLDFPDLVAMNRDYYNCHGKAPKRSSAVLCKLANEASSLSHIDAAYHTKKISK
ncbi:unnamed protein product [Cuscuta europaea]|uniref:Uncharacterized protein n=1 Tax=Cuscuta europaea TaxID=41803 RepID=A0A9P1E1G4_CUSEU|nr:unnamed protein product [Cuscuta europaea]